jgi:thiol-disulfide isomerase/thioredoxin
MLTGKPAYYDVRSDFWRRHWEMAQGYETFIGGVDPRFAERWREREERTPELTEEQLSRLQGYDRKLNVLVYAGAWCGDCARTVPMLKRIADACGDKVTVRVIARETSEELQDELRILGALRVPVVVFLSEDFFEVGREGDRPLSVYRAKAAREAGKEYEAGILTPKAISAQFDEWVDHFEKALIMLRLAPFYRKRYND